MSTKEGDSTAPEEASLSANLETSESLSGVQRSRTEAPSDRTPSEAVESSSHSFPRPANVVSYGQQTYRGAIGRNPTGPISPHTFTFPHPPEQTMVMPGGSASTSPFVGYAPGFPVQQPYGSTMISPLPYSASNPYPSTYPNPGGQQSPVFYSASNALPVGYNVPNYNQRAHTTGSLAQPLPTPSPSGMPSTSYSTGFAGIQGQQQPGDPKMSDAEDECFNLFWLFCLLGPLTWPCALFGICSDRRSERMAGFVSLICLTLGLVVAAVVLSQASRDSDDNSNE